MEYCSLIIIIIIRIKPCTYFQSCDQNIDLKQFYVTLNMSISLKRLYSCRKNGTKTYETNQNPKNFHHGARRSLICICVFYRELQPLLRGVIISVFCLLPFFRSDLPPPAQGGGQGWEGGREGSVGRRKGCQRVVLRGVNCFIGIKFLYVRIYQATETAGNKILEKVPSCELELMFYSWKQLNSYYIRIIYSYVSFGCDITQCVLE